VLIYTPARFWPELALVGFGQKKTTSVTEGGRLGCRRWRLMVGRGNIFSAQ